MKRLLHSRSVPIIAGTLVAFSVFAGDQSAPKMDPKMAEMMKKCEELGTPGPHHQKLDALAGNWDADVTCWMDPSAPPMKSKGSASAKWVMNGRYLQEDFNGEMMGKPFKGISYCGYDNFKQKYNSFWIDDMSTAMYVTEGTADADGKVFTFTGKMDDPMTGEKDKPMKHVIRIVSNDKHIFEMHDPTKGDKSKMMEIVYTRK